MQLPQKRLVRLGALLLGLSLAVYMLVHAYLRQDRSEFWFVVFELGLLGFWQMAELQNGRVVERNTHKINPNPDRDEAHRA